MPGCGLKRSRDPSALTLADIVTELNNDIRSAGLQDVVLIGHSIAGAILPSMAGADPGLFSHLIYLTTSVPLEGHSVNQTMGTSLHGTNPNEVGFPLDPLTTPREQLAVAMFGPDLSGEQLQWLMGEAMLDRTPDAVASGAVTRNGYESSEKGKGFGGEKTYVLTLRDPILPPEWQRRFAERAGVPKERVVEIDTPHEPFVSHPELLAETLRSIIGA